MALVAAASLSRLIPKLFVLSTEEYNLQKEVRGTIRLFVKELAMMRAYFEDMSLMQADELDELGKLFAQDVVTISSSLDGLVNMGVLQLRTAVTSGGWKTKINMEANLKTKKAQGQFASKMKDIKKLLCEMVERRERYNALSTVLPTRQRCLQAPNVDNSADGYGSEEIATVAAKLLEAADGYKFPSEVKGAILFLGRELKYMGAALRMMAILLPTDEFDEGTKAWAEDLKDAYCDVKDAVDKFSSRKNRGKFAADVWDLKQQFLEVDKRRRRYELASLCRQERDNVSDDSPSESVVGPQLPDLLRDHPSSRSPVGLDGHRDVIAKLLTDEGSTSSNQQLRMVSIVGIAGVGKTALARAVYQRIAPQFDLIAWVSLSCRPNIRRIFADLLCQLMHQDEEISQELHSTIEQLDEVKLIDEIRDSLHRKRYLVVVDDIWDSHAWQTVERALVKDGNGAVLMTSRKFSIASLSGHVYNMHPLSETDSKKLFYERLFGSEGDCPPDLADISSKIIAKCCGLPLALVATTDLLLKKTRTMESWNEVYGSVGFKLEDVRRILALSYTDLPQHLKLCLLYLSMFQKGYKISGENLVRGWIAEDLIKEQEELSLLEVGQMYLDEFINRNLIESVEVDADYMAYRVYDSVHDFIISLSTEENFATILNGQKLRYLPDMIHRLSIQWNSIKDPLPKVSVSRVRTLVFSGDAKWLRPLSDCQQLCILDLGGCDSLQNDHLKDIEKLVLLKYLVIGGNCITNIPKEISSLLWLQTLDLRATGLKELPQSVTRLTTLERLCVGSHMKIPDGIGALKALQELEDINISKAQLLKEIRSLDNLRVLGLSIWSWDESYHEVLNEYLQVAIQSKIRSLSILTCCSLHFLDRLVAEPAPQKLQKLEIRHSAFFSLPSWILSIQNLSSLSIEVYKLSKDIIIGLGKLPSLSSLSLTSKHAPDERFGIDTNGFRKLTNFHFVCNSMTEVFEPQPEAMPLLKKLKLSFHASQTEDINGDFNFGLKGNLRSLDQVIVEIICLDASRQVVDNAEAAIREVISKGRILPVNVEIRRVLVRYTIDSEEMVVPNIKQELPNQSISKRSSTRKFPNGLHV